jgi:hypothetical protein
VVGTVVTKEDAVYILSIWARLREPVLYFLAGLLTGVLY